MKMNKLLSGLIALMLLSLWACKDSDNAVNVTDTKPYDYSAMDTTYAPGDNFFMYGNGTWYKNAVFAGYSLVGQSLTVELSIHQNLITALSADENGKKLLADLDNRQNTEDAMLKDVAAQIHEYDNISTKEEAWQAIAKAMKNAYKPLLRFSTYMRGGITRLLYGCPDSFVTPNVNYLKSVGYSDEEAQKIADDCNSTVQKLKSSYVHTGLTLDDFENDPTLNNKIIPVSEMSTSGNGMNVVKAISSAFSIDGNSNVYIVNDIGNYLDALQSLTPEQIKHVIQCEIANDEDLYYNSQYATTPFQYIETLKYDNDMAYFLSHIYTTKYISDQLKAVMMQYAEELREVFKTNINSLDWMSSATKQKALEKLAGMQFCIGRPDTWNPIGLPTLKGTSMTEDMRLIKAAQFALKLAIVGKSRTEVPFEFLLGQKPYTLTLNNCNYDPYLNGLYIYPSHILPPYYDSSNSDAINYACLSVMGHEMTHGFDNRGARCDKDGNVVNWWTVADKIEFQKRQQKLINCYNNMEISYGNDAFVGVYNNGSITLPENIADIGGVHLAFQAYYNKLLKEGYSGDELIKQEKKFFLGLCYLCRDKFMPSLIESNLTNVHSMPKERVNGMVMNTDEWYKLFNVTKDNKLYLPEESRANIW